MRGYKLILISIDTGVPVVRHIFDGEDAAIAKLQAESISWESLHALPVGDVRLGLYTPETSRYAQHYDGLELIPGLVAPVAFVAPVPPAPPPPTLLTGAKRPRAVDDSGGDGSDAGSVTASDDDAEKEPPIKIPKSLALQITSAARLHRKTHSEEVRKASIACLAHFDGYKSVAVRELNKYKGYESIRRQHLICWEQPGCAVPKKKTSRGFNVSFRRAMCEKLVFCVVSAVKDRTQARIVANICHTYAMIKEAGRKTQAEARWADDEKVQKLNFSNCFCSKFLQSANMRRHRVTTVDKPTLPLHEIHAVQKKIADHVAAGPKGGQPGGQTPGYIPGDIVSADESGIGETVSNYLFSPPRTRASSPEPDKYFRISDMVALAGDGAALPAFLIIKCCSKKADMSGTKALKNLQAEEGYSVADGWAYNLWEKDLEIKSGEGFVTVHFTYPFLIHGASGEVITLQSNAYMDTPTVAMWSDLVMIPFALRRGRKMLLVWDNVSCHVVSSVLANFEAAGIEAEQTVKHHTGDLQVIDVVANGPLKSLARATRCDQLFDYFQSWRISVLTELAKPADIREVPEFSPPPQTREDVLRTLRAVSGQLFNNPSFKEGVRRTFVHVGILPQADGSFKQFDGRSTKKGLFPAEFVSATAPTEAEFALGCLVEQADAAIAAAANAGQEDGGDEDEGDGGAAEV